MEKFEIINPTYLLEISNEDIEFVKKICDAFISQTSEIITKQKDAIVQNNISDLTKYIHKLKSAFSVLGIKVCNKEFEMQESNALIGMSESELNTIVEKFDQVYLDAIKEMTIFIKYLK